MHSAPTHGRTARRADRARPAADQPLTREVSHARSAVSLTEGFDLLYLLAAEPTRCCPEKQIMSVVWDDEWRTPAAPSIRMFSSLRSKLGPLAVVRPRRRFRIGYQKPAKI